MGLISYTAKEISIEIILLQTHMRLGILIVCTPTNKSHFSEATSDSKYDEVANVTIPNLLLTLSR
jgi:hypothetical protein